MGKAGLHTVRELGRTRKSPREEANWSLWMGTVEPLCGCPSAPGGVCKEGTFAGPKRDRTEGLFGKPWLQALFSVPVWVSPGCQLCHVPTSSLQQHKPSASGMSTEKHTGKIKIWPFLKVA